MAEPFCRCLLRDTDWEGQMFQTIQEYIQALPDDLRADSETYIKRLNCCKACVHLRNGTCALCGCFVEARAAKQPLHCPDIPDRWA